MSLSKDLLTTQQYAERACVSPSTVSKWIRSGKLKAEKIGNKWMISPDQTDPARAASQKPQSAQKTSTTTSPTAQKPSSARPGSHNFYTVAEFSAMTYLTEFGVTQWLKQGRLKGNRNDSGQWQVEAENLEKADIQRLVRK